MGGDGGLPLSITYEVLGMLYEVVLFLRKFPKMLFEITGNFQKLKPEVFNESKLLSQSSDKQKI